MGFWKDEQGQDLVEYSLLLAFVALGAMVIVGAASNNLKGIWTGANHTLAVAANTAAS